jgi:hypothetical protein
MHKKTKLKTRNKVAVSTTVTLPAPVVMIPDKDDRPTPVLTDRHFLVNIMSTIQRKNYVLLKYYLVDGYIKLKFAFKEEAMMFKLTHENTNNWPL